MDTGKFKLSELVVFLVPNFLKQERTERLGRRAVADYCHAETSQ